MVSIIFYAMAQGWLGLLGLLKLVDRRWSTLWGGLAGLCLGLSMMSVALAAPRVEIEGNRVLTDEIYRSVLQLDPNAQADKRTAHRVRTQILTFLHKVGYDIARVEATVRGDRIVVSVDEGKLERVLVRGVGSWTTLRLKLSLALPENVFCRPWMRRWLEEVRRRYGLASIRYRLVSASPSSNDALQFDPFEAILGNPKQTLGHDYELQILVKTGNRRSGFWPELALNATNGLQLGGAYTQSGLVFASDRLVAKARVGGQIRGRLDSGQTYVALALFRAHMDYFAPTFVLGFRPKWTLEAKVLNRQRPDLVLESYFASSAGSHIDLAYETSDGNMIEVGGGIDHLWIHRLRAQRGSTPTAGVAEGMQLRPFVRAGVAWVFDPKEPRQDKLHRLDLDARYWAVGNPGYGGVWGRYQKFWKFGWNDLMLGVRGAFLAGDVPFQEEEPIGGRYLRGVFTNRFYARRALGIANEFRFSIRRDVHKLSVFHDMAFFGELDRQDGARDAEPATGALFARRGRRFGAGNAFGVGYHALILQSFQLDLYFGFGFASDGGFDNGLTVRFLKAF